MANTLVLITTHDDGHVINEGDTVTDFRGDTCTFIRATRARVPGKSGKVLVMDGNMEREFYDKVFRLNVSGLLTCGCPHFIVWDEGHQEGCTESDTVNA